uniref:Carbamate kinase n=1 Tax=Pyrsonympha sp. LN-2016a TaxID=1812477 RepID=A0A142D9Y4_9EUKA|nr:carbamate kinase [Pyrsonympha sp. LN-2016a]
MGIHSLNCLRFNMVKILIALGGNAIKQANEQGTKKEQMLNCDVTSKQIAAIIKDDPTRQICLTHGNGPQSGNLALQQDIAKDKIAPQPLDIVGAMTQGQIGFMFQNRIQTNLAKEGINKQCVCIINQVLVDINDPQFIGDNASKPVGNFYTQEEALALKNEKNWLVKNVKPSVTKGWRRVVPCPDPLSNVERNSIRLLVDAGVIVIASGGGGIPVVQKDGELVGVEAVIDKDLAGQKLAEVIEADVFLILTDVECACLNFGKPDVVKLIGEFHLPQMKEYYDAKHFLHGSMGPKVLACLRHVEKTGKRAIIASLDQAVAALAEKAGTHIIP